MSSASKFDPVAHLKTMPTAFWLEAPTYGKRWDDAAFQDFCYKQEDGLSGHFFYTAQTRIAQVPPMCVKYKEYNVFFNEYKPLNPQNRVSYAVAEAAATLETQVSSAWNRLRKAARREAGLDSSVVAEQTAKVDARAKAKKKAKASILKHIDELQNALKEYKKAIELETVNVQDSSYIFDMTNEMTSQSAKMKKAFGLKYDK